MQYISLGGWYDGVRLANNNFEKRLTPQVWALLDTLVSIRDVETKAKESIMLEINKLMGLEDV